MPSCTVAEVPGTIWSGVVVARITASISSGRRPALARAARPASMPSWEVVLPIMPPVLAATANRAPSTWRRPASPRSCAVSSTTWAMPVAPSGWPRATRPPLVLTVRPLPPNVVSPATVAGDTTFGGKGLTVNTSGGLVARGHPLGATGIAQVVELTAQLRGEAGRRQVEGARLAVAANTGGIIGSRGGRSDAGFIGIHVLEAAHQ